MSKARSGSSFVREGRQRLRTFFGTISIPIDPNFRAKNRRTVEQWDKDDGNYVNYTNPGSADADWLEEIGELKYYNPNSRIAKIHSKFSADMVAAIYNYSSGSGKFNFPLRGLSTFEGSGGPNYNQWFMPRYLMSDYFGDNSMNLSPKEEKHFERELSRTFKYTTDRGIILARGVDNNFDIPSVGELTQNKGYTSTAYNGKDWGLLYKFPVRYIIRVPKGTPILHISGVYKDNHTFDTFGGTENEILLRKNAVFRTTAVKKQPNGQIYVYQDLLGYGSKNKLKNRLLNGTPDHSIYTPVKM